MYLNILRAHRVTMQSLIFHGSSGYGKTSLLNQYGKLDNLEVMVIRGTYLDPLNILIPEKQELYFLDKPAKWLHKIINTTTPMLVFFDEIGRPSSPQVFNMIMELTNERAINGTPISDLVQFVGATNLLSEDSGVLNFPDAMWKRATHILFAPTPSEIVLNIGNQLAQKVMEKFPDTIPIPNTDADFPLTKCPRQIKDLCKIIETGLLTKEEERVVSIGKLGKEDGIIWHSRITTILEDQKTELPPILETEEDLLKVYEADKKGKSSELYLYLLGQKNQELVAKYLLFFANPEMCRSFFNTKDKEGNNWDYLFSLNKKQKETGPTLMGKTISEVFLFDSGDKNNFEGTEYGEYYKVNELDYMQVELVFENDTVSVINLLKFLQKITDYSLAEVEKQYKERLTRYLPINKKREQLMKRVEEEGEFFFEKLRAELPEKLYQELKNTRPTTKKKRA